MKRLLLSLVIIFFGSLLYAAEPDSVFVNSSSNPIDRDSCTCKGIPLHGRVKVVDSFADFDIHVVESFPDLDVKVVDSFADECGEWIFVDSFADFTVRIVDSFSDFTVRFVGSWPGVR